MTKSDDFDWRVSSWCVIEWTPRFVKSKHIRRGGNPSGGSSDGFKLHPTPASEHTHSVNLDTRAYTPGKLGCAQP